MQFSSLDKLLMCVHKLKILIYIYILIEKLTCTAARQKFRIENYGILLHAVSYDTHLPLLHRQTSKSQRNTPYIYHIFQYSLAKTKVANYTKLPRNGIGRDTSVSIAARYGLDSPGIESR